MSGFFRALTGNNHLARAKRGSHGKRPTQRKRGPFGTRRLQMESLEDRQLLSITLPTIADVTVPTGTSVFVPLAATDPGKTVHYDVTVSDYSQLTPVMMPQTNKSLQLNVAIGGSTESMTFQLLDNLAPTTAQQIEGYVQTHFYDGSSIYRNAQDPLVIQGGNDPPTGAIQPDKSPMAEEFNPDLRFTSAGLLALARSTAPVTSSTEFFVTEDTNDSSRSLLDYNFTIFGVQTGGTSTIDTIAGMPTENQSGFDYLTTPLTITSASIFTDIQNGVLELKAPKDATGDVTVTVTASDGTNAPVTQTFTVTIEGDSASNPANPWDSVTPTAPSTPTYQAPAGTSSQYTNLDNSTPGKVLSFQVSGVTPGNEVEILADGNVINDPTQAVATGTTIIVTTDGKTPLTHTAHEFTAIQITTNQTVTVNETSDQNGGTTPIAHKADVPSLNSSAAPLTVGLPTTVALPADQPAATNTATAKFVVTFAEPVTDFKATTVNFATNLTGSTAFSNANKAQIAITPTGTASEFSVTVTGMDQDGVIVFSCPADTYHNAAGDANALSTGTPNMVTYDTTKPSVTAALASGQLAATTTATATFLVTFNEPVTDFSTTTVNFATNLAGSTAFSDSSKAQIAITPTGTASQFTVTVTGLDKTGTVVFSCPTDKYHDAAGNASTASTGSATVNYTLVRTLTVQLTPSTISEGDGTGAATGTVTASVPAPTGGLTINLTSSNTAQAAIQTSTVTIQAGATSAPFVIDAKDDHIVETSASNVTITASVPGSAYPPATAALVVTNIDVAKTITVNLNPTTIAENAGANAATGTIVLSQGAPTDNFTVNLLSSNTAQATVPLTATFAHAGDTSSAPFMINAVDDGIVDGTQSVTITATAPGYTLGTATLAVTNTDVAKTFTVQVKPSTIAENAGANAATGTVTVPVAPTSDLVVNLTSSNTAQATVDSSVTIKANTTSATFSINAVDDGVAETSDSSVTIKASAPAGSGYTLGTAVLTVTNVDAVKALTVNLNPTTIAENAGAKAATGTVTVPVAPDADLTVHLTSSNTAQATVDATVIIPKGSTSSAPFYINAIDDGISDGDQTVTITATAPGLGYTLGTADLTVTNVDVENSLALTINPSSIFEGGTATGTVTVSQAAPTGGLTVTLVSSDTTEATVGATVTIAAGNTTGNFTITGVKDGIVDGNQTATITATASGYATGTGTVTVEDIDVAKTLTVEIGPATISENDGAKAATGTVTVSVAPTSNLVVNLTSSNTAQATVDATTTILAGHTSATFSINAVDDGIAETNPSSVTITASAPGSGYTLGTATLTVTNTDVAKALTVTLSQSTISEGDGNNAATGTVTVAVAPTSDLVVTLTSSNGAQATVTSSVTIKANTTSATFAVNAVDNGIVDSGNTVTITAAAAGSGYTSGTASLNVTDIDVAKTLTLQVDNTTFSESAGANAATGTVTRTGPTDAALTVTLNSSDTTAATVPATVTIPAGQVSATFPITAVDDHAVDGPKTVAIFATASNYTSATAVTLTVLNADASPTVSISDVANWEDSGKNGFIFTVTVSAPVAQATTVTYTTIDGTAIAGTDYKAKSGTLTIPAGVTSGIYCQINVPVYENSALATNKIFYVQLSNASTTGSTGSVPLTIAQAKATGTIVPDPTGTGAASGIPPVVDSPADDTVGLYSPTGSTFFLRDTNQSGTADTAFAYGAANWIPVAGDWDGNGTETIGLYDPATSTFYLHNTNGNGVADVTFSYGVANAGWLPVAGDWNHDGYDTVGLYDPTNSTFFLRNTNSSGVADVTVSYGVGKAGWKPIAGDWNHDGTDTIGLYNPNTSTFFLRNTNDSGVADVTFNYGVGGAGWTPIAGDWNSDGTDTIGLYNPNTSTFFLRNTNDTGIANTTFNYGMGGAGWTPIVGDWNGPANACLAAGGAVTPSANVPTLTQADLQPIVSEAIARWTNAGLDAAAVAKLTQARFVIADLSGSYLGEADGNVIYIDVNAAGHGWFVDPTAASDGEFIDSTASSSAGQLQAVDPRAIDRMDLLTVVEHELGHTLGLSDLAASADDLMSRTLSAGVRRNATEADAVFADQGSWL